LPSAYSAQTSDEWRVGKRIELKGDGALPVCARQAHYVNVVQTSKGEAVHSRHRLSAYLASWAPWRRLARFGCGGKVQHAALRLCQSVRFAMWRNGRLSSDLIHMCSDVIFFSHGIFVYFSSCVRVRASVHVHVLGHRQLSMCSDLRRTDNISQHTRHPRMCAARSDRTELSHTTTTLRDRDAPGAGAARRAPQPGPSPPYS
jgi:hypothetical protein